MNALKVKQLVEHSVDCAMGKCGNGRGWCADGARFDLDALGRRLKRGLGRYWLKFKCNDPACPAEVAVLALTLDPLIEAALKRRDR